MKKLLAVVIIGIFVMGSGLVLAMERQGQCPCQCQCAPDQKMGHKQEDRQAQRLERLARDLNLTAEQKDKIGAIFKENDDKSKAVMDKAKAEMDAIRDTGDKKVATVLTPEQARKYEEIKAGMMKKMGEGKAKGGMKMRAGDRQEGCPPPPPMMEGK